MRSPIARMVLAAALLWHGLSLFATGWADALHEERAFDFASYYYAARVASDGGDPYDTRLLERAAASDGIRQEIFAYIYPPPFLLAMAWASPRRLLTSYRVWFWVDEIALILGAVALSIWWRRLGSLVPVAIAVTVSLLAAVVANHVTGQVNTVVLALVIAGLWADDSGRSVAGGVFVGIACMVKMSPALFVLWWLLHGRYRAVISAVLTSIAVTLVSFLVVDPKIQWHFYTVVLPSFSSGLYNGLTVPISLFANWSIPAFFDRLFPNPAGPGLGGPARALSSVAALTLVAALAWSFRRDPREQLARAGQASAVAVAVLLVPVYTFEHHLVWVIPGVVVATIALARGRLDRFFAIPVGLAFVVLAFDHGSLRELADGLTRPGGGLALLIREAKLLALLVLLVACVGVGRSAGEKAATARALAAA